MITKMTCSNLHTKVEHLVRFFMADSQNLDELTQKIQEFNEKMPEDKIEFFVFKNESGNSLIFCTGSSDEYNCIGLQVCENASGELIVKNLNAF